MNDRDTEWFEEMGGVSDQGMNRWLAVVLAAGLAILTWFIVALVVVVAGALAHTVTRLVVFGWDLIPS